MKDIVEPAFAVILGHRSAPLPAANIGRFLIHSLLWIAAAVIIRDESTFAAAGSPSGMIAHGGDALRLREDFERTLRQHTAVSYRSHLDRREPPPPYLAADRLEWTHRRENELRLPRAVFESYAFFLEAVQDRDLGTVRVHRRVVAGQPVFAVRVTTDGDSGWLELYDRNGLLLAAGRTYLEIIAWDRLENIRRQAETLELPPDLRDGPKRTLWGKPLQEDLAPFDLPGPARPVNVSPIRPSPSCSRVPINRPSTGDQRARDQPGSHHDDSIALVRLHGDKG